MNISTGLTPYQAQMQQAGHHVLGYYNKPGGYQPGGFTSALIGAFEKADGQNFAKLKQAYPILGYALMLMRDEGEGAVRRWAGIA